MDTEQWKRVKELFQDAMDREPAERKAFLDEACQGDAKLRVRVEAMLAADEETGAFLETRTHGPPAPEESDDRLVGTKIDQYRIEQVIASGGMGTVYQALQEQPRRTVAVKVMRDGITSRSALRRFEYEAQILARLRHPGIAQVIEAGTHGGEGSGGPAEARGLPYFVMEYIEDARVLTDYAEEKGLAIRGRLDLFLQVMDAVQHGHQKGIIHRDLKPSNILVDGAGRVKVIDFGVARATDSDVAITTLHTEVGQLIGTVQYMSPEQCKADPSDLDIRSDVYALGVVLYELLCEELPYDVRRTAIFEAARVIREREPKRPSSTKRALRGDVETIVLKALEKERVRRYQSVGDFAEDLRRHLRGEVILARPAGPATRVWKRVKRNPVVSAAVAAAFLSALAAFLYVVLWAYPRVLEERNNAIVAQEEAKREAEKAWAVNDFLKTMLLSPDPNREGVEVRVVDVLDMAKEKVTESFGGQPELEASVRNTIGSTYLELGQYAEAEEQLIPALDYRLAHYGKEDPDTMGYMRNVGQLYASQGKLDKAEAIFRDLIETATRRHSDEDPFILSVRNSLARVLNEQGKLTEAVARFRKLLDCYLRIFGERHLDTFLIQNNLASCYIAQEKYGEAEKILRRALETGCSLVGEEHYQTLAVMNNLAQLLLRRGEYSEGEELVRKVLKASVHLMGEDHPKTLVAMSNLGGLLLRQGAYPEGESLFRKILEIRREKLGEGHPKTLRTMNNLAGVLMSQEKYGETADIYAAFIQMTRETLALGRPDRALYQSNYGYCLLQLRQYEEAEAQLLESHEGYRISLGADHERTREEADSLIELYEAWGKPEKAVPWKN